MRRRSDHARPRCTTHAQFEPRYLDRNYRVVEHFLVPKHAMVRDPGRSAVLGAIGGHAERPGFPFGRERKSWHPVDTRNLPRRSCRNDRLLEAHDQPPGWRDGRSWVNWPLKKTVYLAQQMGISRIGQSREKRDHLEWNWSLR